MEKNRDQVISTSSEETQKLGEEFVKRLRPGDIVCLYGDLGSGKTTFVQGMARGLGIMSRIISPTFILIRRHIMHNKDKKNSTINKNIQSLYHIDLYRLEDEKSIQDIGLEELFDDKNSIVVIEWAEKLGSLLPKKRWDVRFAHRDENSRKIRIDYIEG